MIRNRTNSRICADPFHVIKLANLALDEVRRTEWNTARRTAGVTRSSPINKVRRDAVAQLLKHTRWALLKDSDTWTD